MSFLADNAAQIPLKVHERAGDNDRPRVTDSTAALLLKQPNPDLTAFEFKRWLYSDLLLYERHLSIIAPSADAPSGWELRPVPSSWIIEYKGGLFAPESVIVCVPGNAPIEIPAERFILFHGYDPTDPMRQYSRIAALRETLHEQVESNAFRRQMWSRGGRFNMYLTRPKDVEKWTNEAFERFKASWKASWAGSDAGEGGGTPILEDGMEIRNVQFNSRDAQWAESVKLSREDCAAVYHVNPALIWPGSGQTYASAKDNARALYNDTLAPLLMQATDRINQDLLARIGEPASHYVVYDITIKTQGTFEERVSAGQTACGVPFMSINEVRGEFNLPAIEGGDEIVQPLNMLYGGLSSVRDTDPTRERYNSLPVGYLDEGGNIYMRQKSQGEVVDAPKAYAPEARMVKGDPTDDDADELAAVYRRFFERQAKSVLPKIEGKAAPKAGSDPPWWDTDRWNRELADDLYPVAIKQADVAGDRAVKELWPDDPSRKYGKRQTAKYIRRTCEMRAEAVNATTLKELQKALEADEDEGKGAAPDGEKKGLLSTARGAFEFASQHRAAVAGASLAAGLIGFAMHEACQQNRQRGENVYKMWRVTSGNPRASHAAMDGETVQMDDTFSNGMAYPGDWSGGSAEECANCQCVIDVEVRDSGEWTPGRITREQIDARDDLSAADKSMLTMALEDAKKSLPASRARDLADSMGECMQARADAYRSVNRIMRTQKSYDDSVGALLADIGDIYGMKLTGGFAEGASKTDPTKILESAIPKGDELWSVTRMRDKWREAHFPSLDRGISKGNPDLLIGEQYADIKTPNVIGSVSNNIHAGYMQCRNRGNDKGVVVVSALHLSEKEFAKCLHHSEKTVKRKKRNGENVDVFVIERNSKVHQAR